MKNKRKTAFIMICVTHGKIPANILAPFFFLFVLCHFLFNVSTQNNDFLYHVKVSERLHKVKIEKKYEMEYFVS